MLGCLFLQAPKQLQHELYTLNPTPQTLNPHRRSVKEMRRSVAATLEQSGLRISGFGFGFWGLGFGCLGYVPGERMRSADPGLSHGLGFRV